MPEPSADGIFRKRLKLGTAIVLIGLAGLQSGTFAPGQRAHANTPTNVSARDDVAFKWVPIVTKSGLITQIGGRTLPVAVDLGRFQPYKKALIAGTTGLEFFLFFPAKDEASIKQHLLRFPNQVPVYGVSKPSFIEKPRLHQSIANPGWGFLGVIRWDKGSIYYVWSADPRPDPKDTDKMNRAFLEPGSPVVDQPRLIALFIAFRPKQR